MKNLSLLLLAALALGSCKKDDNSPSAPSKTDLLTARSWRPTAVTLSVSGISAPGTIDACSADDFLKFGTDKVLIHDEGATKCDPTDPQTDKGTWSMPADGKLMLMLPSAAIPDGTFDIKELSATTLRLSLVDTSGGVPVTVDITMTAI